MDMMLLTFVGLYFLVPAFIVAALAATVISRCGITGRARLVGISLAVAAALSPVLSGAGHGALPLPFIVALLDQMFSSGPARSGFGGVVFYLLGALVLTPLTALVLHLFFPRWAYDRPSRVADSDA